MSYVVHVFEHEPPATLDEALAVFEGLSDARTAANAKFVRLAQALIRRFPSEVGGQPPLQPLWLEEVPDGDTGGSAVYSLGLYGGGIQRLLPALVSEALKLGLCVLDEQAGRCYVPDAWALTEDGRRRLGFQAPPPPPPADETTVPAALTPDWVCRRLLAVVGAALAPEGFVGRARGRSEGVSFSRSTEAGLQHLGLGVREQGAIDVTLHAELEPEVPYALHRACLAQFKLSCQVLAHTALQPHQTYSDRGKAPDDLVGYRISMSSEQFDEQANALVNCLRDEYLPLLKACSDLPGIVRVAQEPGDLPGRLLVSRVLPALVHWAGLADAQAHAEALAERLLASPKDNRSVATLMRRSGRRMAALPELRGAWRPPTVWRALPTPADEVQGDAYWALAWPRLLALAQARGFAPSEPEPGSFRLERQLPDVWQWVQFTLLKRDITSVSFSIHLGTPTLHARWKTLLAPFGEGRSPRGVPFAECNLLPDRLDDFDIDRNDLGFGTDRRDFLADRVDSAERALAQVFERIFDPMQTLAGVAALLQPLDPKLYRKGDAKGGDFERWACWLLLAAEHRPELVADMATLARSFFDAPRGMYGTYYKDEHEAIQRLADEALRLAAYPGSPST